MDQNEQEQLIADLIAGLDQHASKGAGHMTVMPEKEGMKTHDNGLVDEDDIRIAESTKKVIEKKPKRKLI